MKWLKSTALVVILAAPPALASDMAILQRNQAFSQAEVTIQAGDTLKWGNADPFNHNITVKGGAEDVSLGIQKPDQVLSHRFEVAGKYVVVCQIHPRMKMNVIVQ